MVDSASTNSEFILLFTGPYSLASNNRKLVVEVKPYYRLEFFWVILLLSALAGTRSVSCFSGSCSFYIISRFSFLDCLLGSASMSSASVLDFLSIVYGL